MYGSKQSLTDAIIALVSNKDASMKSFITAHLERSFAISAVQDSIFYGADSAFVLSILEYIIHEEPASFYGALNAAITTAVSKNALNTLSEIHRCYPGVDLHIDDEYPLRVACQNGSVDVVQYLMAVGANPKVGNPTAIEAARDNASILALLQPK